jgi:hypothetical protein
MECENLVQSRLTSNGAKTLSAYYKLKLTGVQEVRWEGSGTEPAGECTFCMERGMRIWNYIQDFCAKEYHISN